MGWWERWAGRGEADSGTALYAAVVAQARAPDWYLAGAVPDTLDGRFDMICAVLALVLLRFERDPAGAEASAQVTERFVTDMDGQLRQIGVGDVVLSKQIGQMMGMLGGRIGAYRDGLATNALGAALIRNLYRGVAPAEPALAHVVARLTGWAGALAAAPTAALIAGELP